jgi:hypothetical protein
LGGCRDEVVVIIHENKRVNLKVKSKTCLR